MAKKKWLGMLVMVLVFGMTVVGCGEWDTTPTTKYDNTAYLYVTNTSSIDYYMSRERWDDGSLKWSHKLGPGESYGLTPLQWNDGESNNFTFYYTSERDSKTPLSRTCYYFSDEERRTVSIP